LILLAIHGATFHSPSPVKNLADELLPKLFGPGRHYVDLPAVRRTVEAEALRYEASTLKRYLHEWTREGRIHDAGRGWYCDRPLAFTPDPAAAPLPQIRNCLDEKLPLLEYTLWSTRQLASLFHHLPARHAAFLLVDRDAMEPVAELLREQGLPVIVHPLGAAAKNFTLADADDTVIIRPRPSSDEGKLKAPIERILADLRYEIGKLGLFELGEFQRIFETLASGYRINVTALKRHAERRKLDSAELLALGGIRAIPE
jgi:hypothetical protein